MAFENLAGRENSRRIGRTLWFAILVLVFSLIAFDLCDQDIPSILWKALAVVSVVAVFDLVLRANVLVYVLRRLLESCGVLLVVITMTFVLLRFLPGGPFDSEIAVAPEVRANIEAHYGLNLPISVQYKNYLVALAHGDFGESYKYIGRSVGEIIGETLPISFQLGFYSLLLAFALGIPLGVFAASKHNSFADNGIMILAISGVALPSFIVGPILVMIFCFGVPFAGLKGLLPPALWESPDHYILPVITLGLRPAAIIARMTRSTMLDVIRSDFVRTAKAKGLSQFVVLYKHVLKNALIPVLTLAGPLIAGVLSGSFVVEIIFGIPGMGKHFVNSVTNRDYPMVMGITIVFSVMLVFANLVVDLLYTAVDPRIKLGQ